MEMLKEIEDRDVLRKFQHRTVVKAVEKTYEDEEKEWPEVETRVYPEGRRP